MTSVISFQAAALTAAFRGLSKRGLVNLLSCTHNCLVGAFGTQLNRSKCSRKTMSERSGCHRCDFGIDAPSDAAGVRFEHVALASK